MEESIRDTREDHDETDEIDANRELSDSRDTEAAEEADIAADRDERFTELEVIGVDDVIDAVGVGGTLAGLAEVVLRNEVRSSGLNGNWAAQLDSVFMISGLSGGNGVQTPNEVVVVP